jgi:FkbH-like protein
VSVDATIVKNNSSQRIPTSSQPVRSIAIASTFTAEPVEDALAFWMDELGQPAAIKFAPYNQVFQQLLAPTSLLATNRHGVNVVTIRIEDWQRFHRTADSQNDCTACLIQNAADFINAVRTAMARSSTPLIIALCPNAPSSLVNPEACELFKEIEQQIIAALDHIPNLYLISPNEFRKYPADLAYDSQRDQLGHIPYTSLFYAALGTILARKIHVLTSLPYKVIVLDCDNTIWNGVVGEDGIEGIGISPVWKQMQQHMVELSGKGFLVCLCSKNDETDVLDVFDKRTDMTLKRDHLVSWRINWRPKSENIKSLAQELKLGLDSFIFLDDNPVECAEVRSACPEVLTLQFPKEEAVARFLDNIWPFDRLKITSEDQQRTTMYKQEIERARFQTQALTIDDFLDGLNLQVKLSEPVSSQLSRLAQLTQRTNQFNFTTVRRTEAELQQILAAGLECRVVEVADRFGEYGLVGAMVFSASSDALKVDTFLLSCRVLNRGVEQRMLNELGKIAWKRNLPTVIATVVTTKKNQPARDFLERVAASFRETTEEGHRYLIPAAIAAKCVLSHASAELEHLHESHNDNKSPSVVSRIGISQRYERIATELCSAEQVLRALQDRSKRGRLHSRLHYPFVAPRTEIEQVLAELWGNLLRIEPVGVHDDFFELGGTSLRAVDLVAQIDRQLGQHLPLTSLIEAPTIEQFARLLTGVASRDSVVLIREGGNKPPLFLVHDGDGETMLYRNLAILLKKDHAVYGLQPHSRYNVPLAQTRIPEMAAYHIDKIRSVQPHGPYLLGGMCAGGVIAYEIARQLQCHGETVAMVALLDAADVMTPAKTWRFARQRIRSFSTVFHHEKPTRFDRSVLLVFAKALRKAKNLMTYLVGRKLQNLWDEIRMRLFRFYLDRGLRLPRAVEQIPVRTVYLFAEKNYLPKSVFHGELLLFRATCGEGPDEPYVEQYADPLLGWSKRTSRNVRVCDVPGGHSSMLQEPNVRVLATRMQTYLDQALASELAKPVERLSSMFAEN